MSLSHSDKHHAGSGLDAAPQSMGNRVIQKLAEFMHTATHPGAAPEPPEAEVPKDADKAQ